MSKQDLDETFLRSLLEGDEVEMSVVFSDPSLPDNPMIFVSDEFQDRRVIDLMKPLGETFVSYRAQIPIPTPSKRSGKA